MKLDKTNSDSDNLFDKLTSIEDKYSLKDFPKISIVIPTTNSSLLIPATIESILGQNYPNFEIIIVDSSTDRTLEIIHSYQSEKIRVFPVSAGLRYEMLNKGLSQSTGKYVNFLFPGDYYIFPQTLKFMMTLSLDKNSPDLVYCGALLRDAYAETKILFRPLSLDLLKKGQQPTSLQSCWFQIDTLKKLGKFNPEYTLRGGFDLFCRFCLQGNLTVASTPRVLTDYDLRAVTRHMVATHFWETFRAVYKYFGIETTIKWLFIQKDWRRYLRLWWRSLKVMFFKE